MRPSVGEIVNRSGVARATVYRVLGERPGVSAETRARVMAAIRGLGFPRGQRRGRGRLDLALWLPGIARSLTIPHAWEMVDALESELPRRGGALRMISRPLPESPEEVPLELLREEFAAVFTVAFYSNRHLEVLARRWPVISLFSSRQVPGVVSISPDYAGAARLAVEHLAGLGHRRIGLVIGEPRERNFSRLFLDGFCGAMLRAGLELDPALVNSSGANVGAGGTAAEPTGAIAARELMALPRPPSAILARHDSLVGVVRALGELGLQVGKDVSLIGCGGTGMAGQFRPRLTAVCYSCAATVELALGVLGCAPRPGVRILAPVELVPGESAGSVD